MTSSDSAVLRVRVRAGYEDAMERLLLRSDLDFGCRPRPVWNDGAVEVTVFVPEDVLPDLESDPDLALEVGQDVRALGVGRQSEVGTGDRFDGGRDFPRGLGEAI